MKATCEYRNCREKFEKIVPWSKFCTKECKFAEWGIRRQEESKTSALKEANRAVKK